MKSIIQEGSSVVKAVEKAWQEAGKPQEFTIKIFEEAVKNFIGMTTKPAKIGIFFNHEPKDIAKTRYKDKESRPYTRQEAPAPKHKEKEQSVSQTDTEKRIKWNADMVDFARGWMTTALQKMDKSVPFAVQTNNYYLRFTFSQPVVETSERERQLFRSMSFLLLQALKHNFKRPLRGFKVVLTRKV